MAWFLLAGVGILFSGCGQILVMLGMAGGDEESNEDEVIAYKSYYVKATGNDGSAGTEEDPLATVTAALQKLAADYAAASPAWPNKGAPNEESGGIVILGTVNAKQIDIAGAGYPHIVLAGGSGAAAGTLALSADDYLLMVREGASVSLRNITLKGRNPGGGSVGGFVRVGILGTNNDAGTLRLESGAAVKDNNTGGTRGSGVAVYHGRFIMEAGSEISGNTDTNGGAFMGAGVYVGVNGTFTMNGGTIKGNTATGSYGYGGGVYVEGGVFTMKGGTISGNTATNNGGGVYVGNATFSKTGGIIYGNENTINTSLRNTASSNGHAVYVATSPAASYDTTLGQTHIYPPTP
jgi:hypothetical protein